MRRSILRRAFAVTAAVAVLGATAIAPVAAAQGGPHRFIVVARSAADYGPLLADVKAAGGRIVSQSPAVNMFVAVGTDALKGLNTDAHARGIGYDRIVRVVPPADMASTRQTPHGAAAAAIAPRTAARSDPAFNLSGLMWNINRINAPAAWTFGQGSSDVTVGVADTGLDYTHPELASRVTSVVDFTQTEDPNICSFYFGGDTDEELAAEFHGPANTDWNGHGSWIGGNIAAALDGMGISGIAPKVNLVALKISQNCGSAYDSEILSAFLYAADHGIDIVSISFGGYLDTSDPAQLLIYQVYQQVVTYAMQHGTTIVAAAGNEHVRIGAGGLVLSHGIQSVPGNPDSFQDLNGMYETPGGIPGVVNVSSTNNYVAAPSAVCDAAAQDAPSATCKPTSDAHQPVGVGLQNQLAYYSNYGPRIDVAAPGGARKFNLPVWDRGGTPGWPFTTADGTTAFQTFSVTSNWAMEIPCFVGGDLNRSLGAAVFYSDSCYSTIQGTSMATPHVSAVLALLASRYVYLRHQPMALIAAMKAQAQYLPVNTTQPLDPNDTSAGDLAGFGYGPCTTGYCHNGGTPIDTREAFGAGLVQATRVATRGR